MLNKQEHLREVDDFLHKNLSIYEWKFSVPPGSGKESYFARGFKRSYFVKLGVDIERYLVMADLGFTPPVTVHGQLESGLSIIVQPVIQGRTPSRSDFQQRLPDVAAMIRVVHGSSRLKGVLPSPPSESYQEAARHALGSLHQTWMRYRQQVPDVAEFIDTSLEHLAGQIDQFSGAGLVASHGDICNANWLFASDGRIFLFDFDSLAMDDPALDLGALLWWYYPPEQRQQFLQIAGYPYDEDTRFRMRVRMAMHCLSITLPRAESFDTLDPLHYEEALVDFKAVLNGEENPQGYTQ